MKKNDWIIANLNNPDFTSSDFKNIGGLSLGNTQLLSMDLYLKSDKIKNNELFKDSSGNFSKSKFEDYYKNQLEKFANFAQDSTLDNYEYGFWDVFLKPNSRVRNPEFNLDKQANPTHQSTGVIGINLLGERTKSDFELAEKQKVYDWSTQKFENYTPEDNALFTNPFKFIGNLFSDPLVLAKYEKDTEDYDPLTGELVFHKAGENKLNSEGEYYFETLGGRSISGKQVLSLGDIITKEDTAINKYDFFDSDDIEKSPEGVIAKNLAAVAPMAFLGPWYSGFYVAREILKSLPMMYNIGTMFSEGEVPSMLNKLAGIGQKFTGGTSEHGKSSTFSFENFGNLIGDVALQWGQLKFIAESLAKLKSSNKTMLDVAKAKAASEYERQAANIINQAEKGGGLSIKQAKAFTGVESVGEIEGMLANDAWATTLVGQKAIQKYTPELEKIWANRQKLGQDLSLVYMSMISNTDVYDDMIEHGATKTEAAMVALGSMAGMFAVDKYLGLGEMFFDDEEAAARRTYRQALKESLNKDVKPVIERLGGVEQRESKSSLINLFNKGKESAINFLKDYKYDIKDRSLNIIGKSIGEGLEEMSEEAVTDLAKSLYQLAGLFGWASLKDVGAWDNMEERYLMSLLGGTAGGALFAGVDAIKNPKSASDKNSQKELLHLVKEGRTSDIIAELEKMKNRGMLGSKELSINTSGKDNDNYFVSADEDNISQNDFIYNQMKTAIQQMDKIINGNQLNLTEDLLFERMLLSDIKLMHFKDFLKDGTYMSGYFNEFEKILQDIYNNEVKIQELYSEKDAEKRNSDEYKELLEKLLEEREQLNQYKEEFFKNKSQRYLRKTLFGTNANISGTLLPMTYNLYVQLKYGKEEQYLSENQKQEAKDLYDKYLKTKKLKDFDEAFEAWDEMTRKINPSITEDLNMDDLEFWKNAREEFLKYIPDFTSADYDSRVQPLSLDVNLELEKIGIIKSAEYDKPWKDDPTKFNKAFDLQLEEDPSLFFLIVKDHEDKYWSIHFKTDNPKAGQEGQPYSALNDNQKRRLFLAAALVIPEGEYISTHGELTPGGISGINRFGQKSFTGGIRFIQSGTRNVKTKPITNTIKHSGKIDRSKYTPKKIDIASTGEKEYVLTNNNGLEIPLYGNSSSGGLTVTLKDGSTARMITGAKDPNSLITLNKIQIYDGAGDYFFIDADSVVKVEDEGIVVSDITEETVTTESKDIEIPVWQKNTGETDEEYQYRNEAMPEESEEEFAKRKKLRISRLNQQSLDKELDLLQKLIDSDSVIDSNTYRYIIAKIRQRAKDIKNYLLKDFGKNISVYDRIQEILENLEDDLSNKDEIWTQIETVISESLSLQFYENLFDNGLEKASVIPDGIKKDENGQIGFMDIFTFLYDLLKIEKRDEEGNIIYDPETGDPVMEDVMWDDYDDDTDVNRSLSSYEEALSFIANLSRDANPELIDDLRDFVNIQKYINSKGTLKYSLLDGDEELDGVILHGKHELETEDGELLTIGGPVNNIEYLNEIAKGIRNKYLNGSEDIKVAYDASEVREKINKSVNSFKKGFDATIKDIQSNKLYSILLKLPEKIKKINKPTLKLLKSMANKLGVDFSDIESTLQSIVDRFNELPSASDFRLSDPQILALETANNLIELAKAAIIAASGKDSYFTPWNYNKTINEWNKAHKSEIDGEIDELPELDEDVANILLQDLHQYQIEINLWTTRAKENGINKQKMFKEFDSKFEEVKLKFVMENRHKFILDDGTDLLKGFSEKENAKESVLNFERIFYANCQEALKNGKTEEDLFNAIKNSVVLEEVIKLKSSRLTANIGELTDYDKFIYLITSMVYSPDNFYPEYKNFIKENETTIAPLSFLKYAIRIIKALEHNPLFINRMLEILKEESGFAGQILFNTSIVTGIGGSGKTSVVAKGSKTNNSVISGPTNTQIENLKTHISEAKEYTVDELLKLALDDDSEINKFKEDLNIKDGKNGKVLKFNKTIDEDYIPDISNLKIQTIKNPPKLIIIDEATLLPNATIQVISKFCNINGINLILIGDENLNGNRDLGWNMSREYSLSVRIPRLSLALRENNLWKYQNLDTLLNLEDTLRDTDELEESKAVRDRLLDSDFKKYKLKHYFKNGQFFGDMIINSEITDEQINAINFNNNSTKPNVCFVGDTSSQTYKKLKNSGKVFDVKTLKEVQGYEYDYVICDIDWKNILGTDRSILKTLQFMQALYTVLTRSKDGTMLVNNGLSEIIGGNAPQTYNAPTVNLDEEAKKEFVKYELEWIDKHTWNPDTESVKKSITNSITSKKEDLIEVVDDPDEEESPLVKPVVEEKNDEESKKDDKLLIPKTGVKMLPMHVYTNFNYLGINRKVENEDDEENRKVTWYNDSDSHRDLGIFLRKGEELTESIDLQIFADKLLDLKSSILFEKTLTGDYSSDIFSYVPRENLKDIKYYIVREKIDHLTHHFLTLEQDLEEYPEGTTIYTVKARFKDKDGNVCSLTLGVLPEPDKIRKDITKAQIQETLDKLEDTEENKELRNWYLSLLTNDSEFNDLFVLYKDYLEKIPADENEIRINKPSFLQMTGTRKIKYKLRLELVNSKKSRYNTRASGYVVSPVYASIDREVKYVEPGKPFILVSADRSLRPDELIQIFENQMNDPDLPITVRPIRLDSMGVSFESLFTQRYKDSFTSTGSKNGKYTLPFDSLAMGLRMYIAMHNFRANLIKLDNKIKEKYGDDLTKLNKILLEESRLYNECKGDRETLLSSEFKTWLKNNQDKILDKTVSFSDIEELWNFNENDLQDVKLFRLGFNSLSGVYVRNISDNYNGNYINPSIAKMWLGTINKVFETVLDKIIPPESLNGIGDITEINDYKKLSRIEENWEGNIVKQNWAKILQEDGVVKLTVDLEESSDGIDIDIPNRRLLRAIPIVITLIVKNLSNMQRMKNPKDKFKDYLTDPESKYAIVLKPNKKEEDFEFLEYLDILKGGLGQIGRKTQVEPGVRPISKGSSILRDNRLIDMFNVLFHGAVSLWENTENVNDFLKDRKAHAKDVLFPYGFFVDPILGGEYTTSNKFKILATSPKFYASNLVPSGTKMFVSFEPFVEGGSSSEGEGSSEGLTEKEEALLKLITKIGDEALGENWVTKEVKTELDVINHAREKIKEDTESYFGNDSDIDNVDELLNVPIDIDSDGNIIRLKDSPEFRGFNISKASTLERDMFNNFKFDISGLIFIVNQNGEIFKPSVGTINKGGGTVKLIVASGFIDFLSDLDYELQNEQDLKNLLIGIGTLKSNLFGEFLLSILTPFKNSIINKLSGKVESFGIEVSKEDLEEELEKYINSCDGNM